MVKKWYNMYDYRGKYWKKFKMSEAEAKGMKKHIRMINPKLKLKLSKKKRR